MIDISSLGQLLYHCRHMKFSFRWLAVCLAAAFFSLWAAPVRTAEKTEQRAVETGPAEQLKLPTPYATRSVANPPNIVPWPKGKAQVAPTGFEVSLFAEELDNPRTIYVLPNGDVLVMESVRQQSGSRIILFRDTEKNGTPNVRKIFARRLNMAFGMTLVGNR